MALSLASLIDYAEHSSEAPLDPRVDGAEVVNSAGRYLISMYPWAFLDRPPVNLNFVADQDYVELPADFDQIIAIEVPQGFQTSVTQTTMQRILYLRANTWTEPLNYYVALEYPSQADTEQAAPNARLALYPTPTATESDALVLHYRAGWVELSDVNDVANIPQRFDSLLIQLVRAFALGYSDERKGAGSVHVRLDPIEGSQMVARLKEHEGMNQSSLGCMRGGMLEGSEGYVFRPHRSITLNA